MDDTRPAKIKIHRERRRLYQPLEEVSREPKGREPCTHAAKTRTTPNPSRGPHPPARDPEARARRIIARNIGASVVLGALPFPLLDMVAVTLLQNRMVRQLSAVYGRSYDEVRVKSWIAALVGGAGGVLLARGNLFSAVKAVPLLGGPLGAAGAPIIGGATTYAVGMVFKEHFRSGGTLLDFHPESQQGNFRRYLARGRNRFQSGAQPR